MCECVINVVIVASFSPFSSFTNFFNANDNFSVCCRYFSFLVWKSFVIRGLRLVPSTTEIGNIKDEWVKMPAVRENLDEIHNVTVGGRPLSRTYISRSLTLVIPMMAKKRRLFIWPQNNTRYRYAHQSTKVPTKSHFQIAYSRTIKIKRWKIMK